MSKFSYITSPLDQFEIKNLLSLDAPVLGNLHISLTNIGLYSYVGLFSIITLNLLVFAGGILDVIINPFITLVQSASEATQEQINEKKAALEQGYKDRADLVKERKLIDEAHSTAGDNDLDTEADLGDQLENIDELIIETTQLIADLISWLGS